MLSTRSSASTIHPPPLSDGIQPFFASGTICAGVGGVVLREVVRQAATATLLRPWDRLAPPAAARRGVRQWLCGCIGPHQLKQR